MTPTDLSPVLARHPFCETLSAEAVDALVGCASNVKFADSEVLFRAHTQADSTYLIRSGRVTLELHAPGTGAVKLESAEEGEMVGWSWLFADYEWHFDAIARGQVRAIRLDGACLRKKLEAQPALGFQITKRILFQAQQRLERSRLQALDVYGSRR